MRMLAAIVLAVVLAGCGGDGSSADPAPVPPGSSTSMPPANGRLVAEWDDFLQVVAGHIVRVPWSSLDVEIVAVNDSRCPTTPDNDIACVWEGIVTVDLLFVSDGGATEAAQLVGLMEGGTPVYGDAPTARFDLVDVTAHGIDADGSVMLYFGGLD